MRIHFFPIHIDVQQGLCNTVTSKNVDGWWGAQK